MLVDLHRISGSPLRVRSIEGGAWWVDEADQPGAPLAVGSELKPGDTVMLGPRARVLLDSLELAGGRRGRAHSFVTAEAFASSPSKADVPQLIRELEQLEQQLRERLAEDPLSAQRGPITGFERAMAADFARANLVEEVARSLPESVARNVRAVCLFFNGDSACVAMTSLTVPRIRALMQALGRPINPHLVDEETLLRLLDEAYGASPARQWVV